MRARMDVVQTERGEETRDERGRAGEGKRLRACGTASSAKVRAAARFRIFTLSPARDNELSENPERERERVHIHPKYKYPATLK